MKQFYITVILVFCLQIGFGQIGFEENVVIDATFAPNYPSSVFSIDINGDGYLDIISKSSSDDAIYWFENIDGLGSFGSMQVIAINIDLLVSIDAVDIDGDGDIDVFAGSSYNDGIYWYENLNGQGSFGSQQVVTADGNNSQLVRGVDIDGDGDMDVISVSETAIGSRIVWYENINGDGSFGSQNNIALTDAITVYTLDIDGDGDIDILSASNFNNEITWYENTDGQGDFGSEHIITTTADDVNSVYATDIDNDGDIDVIYYGDRIAWFENLDGQGIFSTEEFIITTDNVNDDFITKDIDSDGDMDILASRSGQESTNSDDAIIWYENTDGQGAFSNEQVITTTAISPSSIDANDLDGDGDMDVISGSSSSDYKIAWYENTDGQETFSSQKIVTSTSVNTKSVYTADIDNDGDMDVLSASCYSFYADGKIAWYENIDGQGTFIQKIITSDGVILADEVFASDIDADGDLDVISVSNDKIAWYKNTDGQGTFGLQQIISNDDVRAINTTDLDGDGDIDILSIRNNNLVWYENVDGQGEFGSYQFIDNLFNLNNIFSVDIDDDGDKDVIASAYGNVNSSTDDFIVWFENIDGQGVFGPQQIITTNSIFTNGIYVDDIDGDGDMDVLSSSRQNPNLDFEGRIAWYENLDGEGTFGSQEIIIYINTMYPENIYTEDLDEDGDKDVIATYRNTGSSTTENKIVWFENLDGNGNFGSEQVITTNLNIPLSLEVDDIDNDGLIDVISAASSGNKIAWFKNLGIQRNEINGNLKIDINSDGCDINNVSVRNLLIETTDGNYSIATLSLNNGFYQLFPNEGTYTTSIASQLPNYYNSNPISQTSNFVGIGNTDTIDFCIEPTTFHDDLNITIYSSQNDPRPGFNTTYQLVYNNIGTTQLSGSVSFEFNELKLNFLNANETVASQTANTLTFDFVNLNPFETRTIDLQFNVFAPPITNIGDELVATATISPVTGDETEDDNVFTLEQTVIGSYDPNDITVLEGEEITIDEADKYLHYLIRFQNTGTASAINVNVNHVLDPKLDFTTMQLESLSHTGRVEIANETDVSFIFNNINLVDSTNDEPNSHGYIAYKIKLKSNVAVGDIISGTADIFFDFNPPITTNTVNTEIVPPLSVNELDLDNVKLFPNPVKNELYITSSQIIDKLIVIDINGRVLNSIEISTTNYSLDVSKLTKGVYFLEIQSSESKSVKKFVKN